MTTDQTWITGRAACRTIGVGRSRLATIVEAGHIAVLAPPGCRALFRRADVERVARESIRPARALATA